MKWHLVIIFYAIVLCNCMCTRMCTVLKCLVKSKLATFTVFGETSVVENFHGFHGFPLNHKCLPVNHGLVNQQYKSTEMPQ